MNVLLKDWKFVLYFYQFVLDICVKVFGEKYFIIVDSYCFIGEIYFVLKDLMLVFQFFQCESNICLKVLGEEYFSIVNS